MVCTCNIIYYKNIIFIFLASKNRKNIKDLMNRLQSELRRGATHLLPIWNKLYELLQVIKNSIYTKIFFIKFQILYSIATRY